MSQHSEETPLLPGLKPVLELLASEPQRIDLVYCRKGLLSPDLRQVQERCRQHGIRYSLLDGPALDRLCRGSHQGREGVAHQGVVARLALASYRSLEEVLREVAQAPLPLLLALDQVQDPGNVGTLCRTLHALGGAGLLLPRHNSAYLGPAARRAAAGALERLPVAQVTNLGHALDSAEEAGLTIYGTGCAATGGTGAGNLDPFAVPLQLPAVLVLGNEERGLRPGIAKRCSRLVRIPLARNFDSLNVAQAGAILLGLTAARQRGFNG